MFVKTAATFAFAFLLAGVHATPLVNLAKRDGNNDSEPIPPRTLSALLTVRVVPYQPFPSLAVSTSRCRHGTVRVSVI